MQENTASTKEQTTKESVKDQLGEGGQKIKQFTLKTVYFNIGKYNFEVPMSFFLLNSIWITVIVLAYNIGHHDSLAYQQYYQEVVSLCSNLSSQGGDFHIVGQDFANLVP